MSKNGWIACAVVVVVLSCVSFLCVSISLVGIFSFLSISSDSTRDLPFSPFETEVPSPSPEVIRPNTLLTPTPDLPPANATPELTFPTPVPVLAPRLVPSDTLLTLENTIIPINDPIELAHRLMNLDNVSPTMPAPPEPLTKGAQETFWVGNGDDENFQVQATLQYVTDHAYFWIEDGVRFRQSHLGALADAFENHIYPKDRSFFGSEWTPGVDGDQHIYILYARGIGDGIAGYCSSADEYPPRINPYSNAHEMFLFNADNSPLDDVYTFGVLAHELQHMIHWYQDRNESNWMGEGFSELAVLLNNYYNGGFDNLYINNPDLQLNNWPDDSDEDTTPHYGAGFLFLTYFLDRFGEDTTKMLVANQENDLDSIDSTLRQAGAMDPTTGEPITADDFFLDWAITNYLRDSHVGDGRYNYVSYQGAPRVEPAETYSTGSVPMVTTTVHQYGVDYLRFSHPGTYTLHFEGSILTQLLPQDPHSGAYAFWANKSDESDTTLTQTFDFTDLTSPITLDYWTWYDIEEGWDYAYLEASLDGESWHILHTPSGTDLNPQGNSYGWGYTGSSGGGNSPVWIHESIDLSRYAGQKVTLRFEYITDSNVTGEGFMVDDVSISAMGYATDFESNSAGWQADGWARIQNVLPQSYRLAMILDGKSPSVEYISLNADNAVDINFTVGERVDEMILVVSGTTRFTRQLAPYRFEVVEP